MSRPTAGQIRQAAQGLCEKASDQFSYADIFHVLGVTDNTDRELTRSAIRDFTRRGEFKRVRDGVFTYHSNAVKRRQAIGYQRMWRAIRAESPGWTTADIEQVTAMSRNHVQKYCRWLKDEGYITPHGRNGNTQRWRVTTKGRNHRDTLYPPRAIKDPYKAEKNAACRLVRCLMSLDPGKPVNKKKIITECITILARFQKGETNAPA